MKINTSTKLYNIFHLFKYRERYCSPSNTYYPEETRKSAFKILKEQIRLICKYGSAEPYYFLYGFDRTSVTKEVIDSYLNFKSFQNKINDLNTQNPFTEYGRFCGRVITADKYYFYLFCSALNIPVVDIL